MHSATLALQAPQMASCLDAEGAALAHLCHQRCARDIATTVLELVRQDSQRGGNGIDMVLPLRTFLRSDVRTDQRWRSHCAAKHRLGRVPHVVL